ncbi:MAG: DNA polymerase III subunit epsilon [Gammaproteobacteria bacterium]|nr:MAG: DNA polymerase III subunit epsilon [Gammaproteobacteria bacterium]
MRQIILDTETTGLEPSEGHRIIEIGCVELINRQITGNTWHQYIQPEREIDAGAIEVHGITNESLVDKPRFADIAGEFLEFIRDAELVIHNAPFDIGFLDHELKRLDSKMQPIAQRCSVVDTLVMARRKHPGQRNSLDALCKRYEIDNSQRELHGALLDAEILADVYLVMTGGQASLSLDSHTDGSGTQAQDVRRLPADRPPLRVITATADEQAAHDARLDAIGHTCGGTAVWRQLEEKG